MKELYQCHECGFLNTHRDMFLLTHGELHCRNCAKRDHGTIASIKTKKNPQMEKENN